MAWMDTDGLRYLWSKVVAKFVRKESGKGLSTNDYTTAEKNKLAGIVDMKGATASTAGAHGLVPAPVAGNQSKYLRGDGTWAVPPDTNTTYQDMKGASASAAGTRGLVPAPAAGNQGKYLKGDGTWGTPPNTTYSDATQSAHGLMSAADKKKLDGVEAGAEVNQNAFSSIKIGMHDKNAGPDGDAEIENIIASASASAESSNLFFNFIDGEIPFEAVIEDSEQPLEAGEIRLKARLARVGAMGFMSGDDYEKLNALPTNTALAATYAKKSDITGMYKYKGSVASAANLPTSGQVTGDVYNIESASTYGGAGMNVAWNGTKWDPLGEIFTITAITNAEIDAICV